MVATPFLLRDSRSGGCTGATKRSYPMSRVRSGGQKEIPHVQCKEQWLHFAGAAVKRYPTSKVRETQMTVGVVRGHQRADTLKSESQKTSQSDHTDHSLV